MKLKNALNLIWHSFWIAIVLLPIQNFAGEQAATNSTSQRAVQLVANYRKWKKANKEPVVMDSVFAGLCNTSPNMKKLYEADPHENKYINVYVNESGYHQFVSRKKPQFTEGTVIVKEKLLSTNSPPELLTVMVKRKLGFDSKNGDWEYLAFNGQGTKLLSEGKTQNCRECHEMRKSEDYVFRKELGPDIWQSMK